MAGYYNADYNLGFLYYLISFVHKPLAISCVQKSPFPFYGFSRFIGNTQMICVYSKNVVILQRFWNKSTKFEGEAAGF